MVRERNLLDRNKVNEVTPTWLVATQAQGRAHKETPVQTQEQSCIQGRAGTSTKTGTGTGTIIDRIRTETQVQPGLVLVTQVAAILAPWTIPNCPRNRQ